jgi:type 1 fimbria pilin
MNPLSDSPACLGGPFHRALPAKVAGNPASGGRGGYRSPALQRAIALLSLLLVLAVFSNKVRAECDYDSGSASTITFSPPSSITVPTSTQVGTVLWTSAPITPSSPYLVLDCSGSTSSGISNTIGGQPSSGDNTLFPTNIPWLSYRILHPDTSSPLRAYPSQTVAGDNGGGTEFSVASALQLVVTGPVTYSGQLSGQLGVWQMNYYRQVCTAHISNYCYRYQWQASMQPLATFTTSTVRFIVPACTVAVDPTVVTLPTVMASNFSGPNSTAGQTGFDVKLTCSASTNLSITLATSSPATGVSGTGVIAPTSGSGMAQGIGVQIRDGNGNPISFNTVIPAGTTSSGPYAIPFQARYYQTAAVISGGNVSATATYTLTYQ